MQIVKLLIMRSSSLFLASSLLSRNIFLSILFSNTISLLSSLNESDEHSHQYKIKGQNSSSVYLNLYIAGW